MASAALVANWPDDARPPARRRHCEQTLVLPVLDMGETGRQHRGHHAAGQGAADLRATTCWRTSRRRPGWPSATPCWRPNSRPGSSRARTGRRGTRCLPAPVGRRRGRGAGAVGRRDPPRRRPAPGRGRIGDRVLAWRSPTRSTTRPPGARPDDRRDRAGARGTAHRLPRRVPRAAGAPRAGAGPGGPTGRDPSAGSDCRWTSRPIDGSTGRPRRPATCSASRSRRPIGPASSTCGWTATG